MPRLKRWTGWRRCHRWRQRWASSAPTWIGFWSCPGRAMTEDNLDVDHAGEVLEQYHYGLGKAKDRILEYIAVAA